MVMSLTPIPPSHVMAAVIAAKDATLFRCLFFFKNLKTMHYFSLVYRTNKKSSKFVVATLQIWKMSRGMNTFAGHRNPMLFSTFAKFKLKRVATILKTCSLNILRLKVWPHISIAA